MPSPSLACDPSIGSQLADFLPASVVNIVLAFSFIAMQPALNNYFPTGQINSFTFAMNVIGNLFSAMKRKEILVQVSPTPTIKGLPTPTLQYQPESTSSILYAVALCAVLILVGAVFTVFKLRNNISSPSSSSVNLPFDIAFTGRICHNGSSLVGDIPENFRASSSETPVAPSDDPIDPSPSNRGADSESKLPGNDSSELVSNTGGSPPPPPPPSFTTSGMDDASKNAPGFLAKLKMFLIIFVILTTFTHGGRIAQKLRSLAIHDDFTFPYKNASVTPYLHQALELITTKASHLHNIPATFTRGNTLAPEIVKLTIIPASSIPSPIVQVKYNEMPSSSLSGSLSPSVQSRFSFGSNEEYDSTSLSLPTKDVMSFIPTSAYPIGLSLVEARLGTPTTSNPSRVALALEYTKMFTIFFVFCIFIPILSFVVTILPTVIQLVRLLKSGSADQRETFTHAVDDDVMKLKVDVNEAVLAIEIVKDSKVGINIIHDEVVPVSTFVIKGKGKVLEAIEEKDETAPCPLASEKSLDLASPTLSTYTLADGPRQARSRRPGTTHRDKRRRKAERAAIEAALAAGSSF